MNQADGSWNLGESPDGIDAGGVLGSDLLLATQPTYEARLPGGWEYHNVNSTTISHYIGRLRPPNGVYGQPGFELPAAFQVVAPTVIESGKRVVVVIFTHATFGGTNPQNPHAYPGNPNDYDLLVPSSAGPHVDVVDRNLQKAPSPPFRVVAVQFCPRCSQRPTVSLMQRLRQVRLAVIHLLRQRYGIPETQEIAFHIDCASYGGFTAQLAPLFYPTEFHSGSAGAFSAAIRSMPSDFDSHLFMTSLLGADSSSHSYLMRDTVEIPMWCKLEGTNFASVSLTNRWYLGHMQRPVYLFFGDEDSVTHGTDWIQILQGPSPTPLEQPQSGAVQFTNVFNRVVDAYWSIVAKSGHSEPRAGEFTLRGVTPTIQTDDLSKILDFMLEQAHGELLRPPVFAITNAALGKRLPETPALRSLDPSLAALGHSGTRVYSTGTRSNLLLETPGFKRYGQGTWLGANESLKVKKLGVDLKASVFVGSADGYVTRLVMEDRPLVGPTIKPLVEVARTNKDGQPYALGHGTWGLDVGDVDFSYAGDEVVVASYNRIALFRAESLTWIREVVLPDWEYTNPRKLQVADMIAGTVSDELEIVFRTLHGHLVIMDKTLQIKYEHREGGIVDLVIGPAPEPRNGWLKRPIYILSARGHIVRLEIDSSLQFPANPNAGILAAASSLEYGGMRDLDLVTYQGQTRLAALFVPHLGTTDTVRFFSVTDCNKVGEFGDIQNPPPTDPPSSVQHAGATGDMEPSFTFVAGHGGDRWVISSGGHISLWDGAEVLGHKALGTFAPTDGHGCVQAGDIDPSSPNVEEIVVATTSGKVVWLKLSDLTTPGTNLGQYFARAFAVEPDGTVFENRCNLSLGATWAMSPEPASGSTPGKLRVIDATGTWWEVDPTGKPTFIRNGAGAHSLIAANASTLSGSGGTGVRSWSTLPIGTSTLLISTPYLPVGAPAGTWAVASGNARPFVPFQPGQSGQTGHWVLPKAASYVDGSTRWCAWWQMAPIGYANLIQRLTYTVDANNAVLVQDLWGSTGPDRFGAPRLRWPDTHPDYLKTLRSEIAPVMPHHMLGIAIGRVLPTQTVPQIIATNMGGRVMVLHGDTGAILTESADYGIGGMALTVANVQGDAYDEIIFAPHYSPIPHLGGSVRSHIHVLQGTPQGGLTHVGTSPPVPVAGNGTGDFLGYGACGLAVVDLAPLNLNPPLGKVVIVTTLNGELAVFQQNDGVLDPTPLYRKIVEGSLGAFGSIVVANLDPSSANPELYLAGSSGIRRFDFQ